MNERPTVLEIDGLCVKLSISGRWVPALNNVRLAIHRSEALGLMGESGSGKSLTALSVPGLLPGDKWHMDEVFIRDQGVQHCLWRAVDPDGVVRDVLVQARRAASAAKRFSRRRLKGMHSVPRVIVTDKLRSYGVANRAVLPNVARRQSRYLNNRAENSNRPTRPREQQRQRFES